MALAIEHRYPFPSEPHSGGRAPRYAHKMNIGHISGGTNAGWKRQNEKPKDWTCPSCGTRLRYFWPACPNDNTRRPDSEE